MSKNRPAIALLICGIAAFGPAQADSLSGRVVAVADGDTVTLLDAEHHLHRIRVAGIDAPEKKQDFGDLSKLSLAALVFNRNVDVIGDKMDRYGRRVGKIMASDPQCEFPPCPKTLDAGLVQIKSGMAWWYRQYAKEQSFEDRVAYEQAEVEAKLQLRGLWMATSPAPPWEWRNNKRHGGPKTTIPLHGEPLWMHFLAGMPPKPLSTNGFRPMAWSENCRGSEALRRP